MNDELKKRIQTFGQVLADIPELTYAGNPILRIPAAEVEFSEALVVAERLTDVLLRYRKLTGFGRGLAAPQIGEGKAVFVTYVDDKIETFINPRIAESSDTTNYYKELCMSCGVVAADVARPEWIVLEWMDSNGERHTEKFDGFKARLYQHEEAHLRGRLNLDDAEPGKIELVTFDPLQEKLRPQ